MPTERLPYLFGLRIPYHDMAVRHATGGRMTALPLTPERVFMEINR